MRPQSLTEYVEFKDCGHVPMDERPDEFRAVVIPFIDKILSAATPDALKHHTVGEFDAPEQPLQSVKMTTPELDAIPVRTAA